MRQIAQITSVDNPRVKAVLKLRRSRARRRGGRFIAEGFREVTRALEAKLRPIEWFACPAVTGMDMPELVRRLPWHRGCGDALGFEVSDKVLRKMAYRDDPEGLIGVFEQPHFELASLPVRADGLWLVAAGLTKPGNLGAMARTAAAAGANALIAADAVVDAFNPNAIRASTGAVFSLPVVCAPAAQVIAWLRGGGIHLAAAAILDRAIPYTFADLTGPTAIVIGAEDTGLDQTWIEHLTDGDYFIEIPMAKAGIDSLNASVAAGILLFEAVRQRGGAKNK